MLQQLQPVFLLKLREDCPLSIGGIITICFGHLLKAGRCAGLKQEAALM